MVIAERTTSYGFLAAGGVKPVAIATRQTDLWPENRFHYPKKIAAILCFQKSRFNSCLGPVMTIISMIEIM
jgi:hypothetical protein